MHLQLHLPVLAAGLLLLLRGVLSLTVGSALHCAVRREISPCTCRPNYRVPPDTVVTCEGMANFSQVLGALRSRFDPKDGIILKITYSALDDLPQLSFEQLGLHVKQLTLNHDGLSLLPDTVFAGLNAVEYFSLAYNALPAVPHHILKHMPHIKTLDIGYGSIQNLTQLDFQDLLEIKTLIVSGNNLSSLEATSLPKTLRHLHLGHNKLTDLNGTLRSMSELEWLFLNNNSLSTLDDQLPASTTNNNLYALFIHYNDIRKLPMELRNVQALENINADHNRIGSLDGALAKSRKLRSIDISHNWIEMLQEDDFSETEMVETLNMGYNRITSLNSSLLSLHNLRHLNLTHNKLAEFSLQDIRGLRQLIYIDLSYNKISKLGGRMENLVEMETRVFELRLEHNELESLSGSLMGLTGLHRLNLSHNLLNSISPDDFIGLDDLRILDISHNRLTTLEETSKTFLPSLEELLASYNSLTILERDFHGLPVLCWADVSHNKIHTISRALAEKTQCRLHGVNSTLRIYLQGNPVLCDKQMTETILLMESKNNTKIHGQSECPPPPVNDTSMLLDNQVIVSQPQVISASQLQGT